MTLALEGLNGPPLVLAEWVGRGSGAAALQLGPAAAGTAPLDPALLAQPHTVRVTVDAARQQVFATLQVDGAEVAHQQVALSDGAMPARPVALSLTSGSARAGAVAEIAVRSLSAWGLSVPPAPSRDPVDVASRALLTGDAPAARAAAAEAPAEQRYLIGLMRSASIGAPRASLHGLPASTTQALLLRHPRVGVAASRHDGAACSLAWLHQSWEHVLHGDNPPTAYDPMLLEHVGGALAVSPGDHAAPWERRAHLCLLADRAGALRRSSRVSEAASHVRAARALARSLDDPTASTADRDATARVAARVEVEQARIDLLRGRPEAALRALRAAVARSPHSEALADRVVTDPAFASLRDRSGWEEIERARRLVSASAL